MENSQYQGELIAQRGSQGRGHSQGLGNKKSKKSCRNEKEEYVTHRVEQDGKNRSSIEKADLGIGCTFFERMVEK